MSSGPEGSRPRYLTVAEVAETMRVSKMTVYRLAQSGELPAVRVGRSYRVPIEALEAYLAASPASTVDGEGHSSRRSG
ncbi:helix-turn-helix domain-containing protein [Actinotalea sp.]|uniref:helix-turn-helix domain-containing protein n=1 Tax=Actinotalea sp. TaxID=1872145 RepID=UPI0035679B26